MAPPASLPDRGAAPSPRACHLQPGGRPLRRPPAELQSPRRAPRGTRNPPASDRANPPPSPPPRPDVLRKESSGESSDAGRWFESSNYDVRPTRASFLDGDPPFFLRHSSSSETPPDAVERHGLDPDPRPTAMPHRPGPPHLTSDAGSLEEFRGVIDDLTVANKRLKRKLRRYEKMYDAHLHDEKLFEIRVYRLPSHKKKELEGLLTKFATGLDDGFDRYGAQPQPHAASSRTSAKFTDSAYLSVSASARSGRGSHHRPPSRSAMHRQRSIQSYLQDIPAGLLPERAVAMTDEAKKKLVVRRLEQIFAGKGPAPGGHQQPLQQEEVARSAAMADRRALEASGVRARAEGAREAKIMTTTTTTTTTTTVQQRPDSSSRAPEGAEPAGSAPHPVPSVEQDLASARSPDQRPTRPLDLDPHRAQVPADNMEYMRHLGFSPLDVSESPPDGKGWIYLNLLISIAQLHILNVTTGFVKEAVAEYSSKLELSSDGRKIRWRGGRGVSRHSRDGSPHQQPSAPPRDRRPGTNPAESRDGRGRQMREARIRSERDDFTYTPLFFHDKDSDSDDLSSDPDDLSSDPDKSFAFSDHPPLLATGHSSSFASSRNKAPSARKRRDEGPIIFYSKAGFCTDLSGDRRAVPSPAGRPASYYHSITSHPVGSSFDAVPTGSSSSGSPERRGPLADASRMPDPMDLNEPRASSEKDIRFSPERSPMGAGAESSSSVIEFEASGIGGVQPRDNFAINVHSLQKRTDGDPLRSAGRLARRPYPQKILDALGSLDGAASSASEARPSSVVPKVSEEIIAVRRRDLPASQLPPASFFPFFTPSDEYDGDSDVSSDVSSNVSSNLSSNIAGRSHPPTPMPQQLNFATPSTGSYSSSTGSGKALDEENGGSDASIDVPAAARGAGPAATWARERECDAGTAERLAGEIPAGSSAATAGGGSGYNSPALAARLLSRQVQPPGTQRTSLKRMRTSDSFAVHSGKVPKTE